MTSKGFLLVMMQPPPALEDEFNAWYDSEHIPERLAVPGFLTGLRFVCLDGHPRYLALYDLERYEVLQSPAYLKVGYDQASPWTKRVTSRVKVWRYAGRQVIPGDAVTGRPVRLQVLRFHDLEAASAGDLARAVEAAHGGRPGIARPRILVHESGAGEPGVVLALTESKSATVGLDMLALGPFAAHLDLVNTYAAY